MKTLSNKIKRRLKKLHNKMSHPKAEDTWLLMCIDSWADGDDGWIYNNTCYMGRVDVLSSLSDKHVIKVFDDYATSKGVIVSHLSGEFVDDRTYEYIFPETGEPVFAYILDERSVEDC
jgi:hypothetical protein